MRGKRCSGGQPNCKNYVGDYKDIDDVGCCKACDDYIDENPYDPYWEQMEQAFGDSPEYEEAEKSGLLEHVGGYEKAFEKFQETYEPWPDMRRRMAKKNNRTQQYNKVSLFIYCLLFLMTAAPDRQWNDCPTKYIRLFVVSTHVTVHGLKLHLVVFLMV